MHDNTSSLSSQLNWSTHQQSSCHIATGLPKYQLRSYIISLTVSSAKLHKFFSIQKVLLMESNLRAMGCNLPYGITQYYLPRCHRTQVNTPCLNPRLVLNAPTQRDRRLTWPMDIPRWFTHTQTVIHPSTNPAVHSRQSNSQPVDHAPNQYTTKPPSNTLPPVRGNKCGTYNVWWRQLLWINRNRSMKPIHETV